MKISFLLFLASILVLSACKSSGSDNSFVSQMEQAHQKENFLQHEAIQFNLMLVFGGKERLRGTLTLLTNSTKGRIDYEDGRRIIYDQETVYYSPEFEDPERAEFAAYTWSYFFLMPYKLSDPGAQWEDYPEKELEEKTYEVQKLTFESGTGGSPDDWYIVYQDPETRLMHSAAYIVTANKSQAEAEEDPHAIQYSNYNEVEGIPIAQSWTFWGWQPVEGFTEELGHAELKRVRFTQLNQDFFDPLPGMSSTRQ